MISHRYLTPVYAILVVSVVSLLAIVIDLAMLASLISFGALVAFSAVNLSVIKHYFADLRESSGGALINNLILPFIGFALTVWLWTSLSGTALVIGLSWLAVGFVWLLGVTRGVPAADPGDGNQGVVAKVRAATCCTGTLVDPGSSGRWATITRRRWSPGCCRAWPSSTGRPGVRRRRWPGRRRDRRRGC